VLGDFLVLVAAFLYACSNVMQEASLLDGATAREILAHVGGIGACISGLQCAAFESEELASAKEAGGFVGFCLFAAFAASLFAMYAAVPSVLSLCGAAAFNVNMLSADLWAAAARVMIFGGFGSWASGLSFVASLAVVTIGLVVFAAAGEPLPPDRKRDGAVEMRYEVLDEEGGGGGDEVSSGRLIAGDA
jgi:solute carrier family 35 protein F1/2